MKKKEEVRVMPTAEEHIAGYHAVVDSVARERRYLAMLQAFPLESTAEFVRTCIRNGYPHYVALKGDRVIGWCDIQPAARETQSHGGTLGMGIIDGYRGGGVGTALMRATLEGARKSGLTRVELTVREDNERAKKLYERAGFKVEGVKRKAALHDGQYYDLILMALLFEP